MHNLRIIETKRLVTCDFSAYQWGLYINLFPREAIEKVADRLNQRLNEYANEDYTKAEVLEGMYQFMHTYKDYGAFDTEPRVFLELVLEEIYK